MVLHKSTTIVVYDDHELSDDSGEVPKQNGVGGGSTPDCEIVSLLDGKLARWSSASCVPKRKKKEDYNHRNMKSPCHKITSTLARDIVLSICSKASPQNCIDCGKYYVI